MAQISDCFGKYPFDKDHKKPLLIDRSKIKMFIYTPDLIEKSDLNYLYVSTDQMTIGKYRLSPGSTFDPVDVHAGDEVYYVLYGTIHMLNPKTGQVEKLERGQSILLPKGAPHKAYNFTNDDAMIFFCIAPAAWDEHGPPDGYFEEMKLLKTSGSAYIK